VHSPSSPYPGYSRENEFLLQLLGRPRQELSLPLQATASQVDWQRLFQITPPDLTAYLEYKIREHGFAGQCPAELLREAGHARLAAAARWLRLRFELQNLVREFRRHEVEFVILKGAVLAFMAYPDSSLRPVSDVDLLVRPESLAKSLKLIGDAGFKCPKRFEFTDPLMVKDFVVPGEEISLPLEKPGTQALIEVHTQLESAEPWFAVPTAKVWEHVEKADWNDLCIPVLDAHEFLFHLVLHLSRGHFFSLGLRPLLDIHLWVELQAKRLDWDGIRGESIVRGYRDWMYLTLKMVRDCFATGIPSEFFTQMEAPLKLNQLESLAYEQIWLNHGLHSLVPPRLAITFSHPSVGQAIGSLFRRIGRGKSFDGRTIPALRAPKTTPWLRSFRGLLRDLKIKAPLYLRAWRNGSLAWSSLRQAARLVRGRGEIREILMNRHETGRQQEENG
jgi:Uncharacterised nucleotidyltransferase